MPEQERAVQEIVAEAMREGDYCCQFGCGPGACEVCPCCSAGWCVMGADGITPFDESWASEEDRTAWLRIAVEHNPVARALNAAEERIAKARAACATLGPLAVGILGILGALDGDQAQSDPYARSADA